MADDKEKLQLEFEITYDASGEKKVLDGAKRIGDAYKTVGENAAGAVGDLAGLEKPVKGVVEEAKKLTAEKNRQIEAEKKLAAEKKRTADQEERITNALSKREKKSMDTAVAPYIERERREQDLYKKLKSGEVSATDLLSQGKKGAEAVDKMADSTQGLTNAVDAFATKVESKVSSVESVVNVVQQAETGIRNLTRELNIFDMAVAAANKDKPDAMMQRLVLWGKEQKAIEGVTAAVGKMEAPIQKVARAQDAFAVAVAAANKGQPDAMMQRLILWEKERREIQLVTAATQEIPGSVYDAAKAQEIFAAAVAAAGGQARTFAADIVEMYNARKRATEEWGLVVAGSTRDLVKQGEGLLQIEDKTTEAQKKRAREQEIFNRMRDEAIDVEWEVVDATTAAADAANSAADAEERYAAAIERMQKIAHSGPLNVEGLQYVPRVGPGDETPENYNAKLGQIRQNLLLLNEEIELFIKKQEAALDSARAQIDDALAIEDNEERLKALSDATREYNRLLKETTSARKQATLLSQDYIVGLIKRIQHTEEDSEANIELKNVIADLESEYYSLTGAMDNINRMATDRNNNIKDEITGTKDLIAAKKQQDATDKKLAKQQKEAWNSVMKAGNSIASTLNTINQLTRRFGQSFTRYVTAPLAGFAIKAAKFAADMEMNLKSIEILLRGNVEAANDLYTQVVAYSAYTPYEIPDLTEATKQLLSFGTTSQDVMGELRMLGDLAQNDAKKLDSLTQAFGKSQARGAIHMRELNRFILSGIPIMQALADVTDTSMSNIVESVQKGAISFKTVKAAMLSLTSEGGKFYNMSEKLSQTIKGRWATMNDEINLALKSFIDDYMPGIKKGINWVIEFAQALQHMSLSQKQVILDTVIMAAKIGPILLGVSAATAAISGLTKVVLGLAKALNVLSTAAAIKTAIAGAGAPLLTILAAAAVVLTTITAVASGVTRKVKEAKDLMEESLAKERAKADIVPSVDKAISTLYGQKSRGESFSPSAVATLKERYAAVDEDTIRHMLDTTEQLTISSALDTLNTKIENSQKDMAAALETIAAHPGYTTYRKHAIEELGEGASELDILSSTIALINEYVINQNGKLVARGTSRFENLGAKIKKGLDEALTLYTNAILDLDDMNRANQEYTTALDLIQQRYIGSVVSPGATSGALTYGSFYGHLAETSEPIERVRRLVAASTQDMSTLNLDSIRNYLDDGLALDAANIKSVLKHSGVKEGSVMYDILEYLLGKEGGSAEALDEVLLFFKDVTNGIDTEIDTYLKEQENKFKTDNILNYIIPGRDETLETGQKSAENMAGAYEAIASNVVQGLMADTGSFDKAIKRFLEDPAYNDLRKKLQEQLALSESKKIFKKIEDETKNAATALKGIDWNPVEAFQNNLLDMLDSIEGIDKEGAEYLKYTEAIKQGAKNMAEAAQLTSKKDLQDVIDRATMSDKDYYFKTLTRLGIASTEHEGLWQLKGQGDFLTQEKDLNKQLDVAKAITDEQKIQALAVDGISLDQARILFYLQKQIDAYAELNSVTDGFKNFVKENLYNEQQNFSMLMGSLGISDYTGVENVVDAAVYPTTKPARGVDRINERNEKLKALGTVTRARKTAMIAAFTDEGGNVDVPGLMEQFAVIDTQAEGFLQTIDELFPVTDAMLFDDALKDIGDSLISLGLTGVVGMFEDFGKALASGSLGADSFNESMANMLTSLASALPQLFLNAGLSLISVGKWKVGLALVGMSAVASVFKGLAEGGDAQVTGTTTGITLTKSAKGNLFSRGELLNSPTLFRTQSGFNLAGEQGTEAVMPLGRTSDGKLGIYAMGQNGGGQANVVVNVINNSDNSEPEVVERTDANGTKTIDVIIKNIVNKQIAEGGYDRTLGSRYGVKNRGIA